MFINAELFDVQELIREHCAAGGVAGRRGSLLAQRGAPRCRELCTLCASCTVHSAHRAGAGRSRSCRRACRGRPYVSSARRLRVTAFRLVSRRCSVLCSAGGVQPAVFRLVAGQPAVLGVMPARRTPASGKCRTSLARLRSLDLTGRCVQTDSICGPTLPGCGQTRP